MVEGVKKVKITIPTCANSGDTIHVSKGGKMQLKTPEGVQRAHLLILRGKGFLMAGVKPNNLTRFKH